MNRDLVEPLEPRRHFAAYAINFQPAGVTTPADMLADLGAVYGMRGGGLSYGWSSDNRANARTRGLAADVRYDTLIHFQKGGNRTWEMALPAGQYEVTIVAGDAGFSDGRFVTTAESVKLIDYTPTDAARFGEGAAVVTVTDGKLTLTSGDGAINNKICFLRVESIAEPGDNTLRVNFQPVGAAIPSGYVADTGLPFASRGVLAFGWDADNRPNARERNDLADQRYDTFTHTQKGGNRRWEIALPAGKYRVKLVAGDSDYFDSRFVTLAEGNVALDAAPTSGNRYVEGSIDVVVRDGRLTLTNGTSAVNNKLAFLEITPLAVEIDAALAMALTHAREFAAAQLTRTVAALNDDANAYVVTTDQTTGAWTRTTAGDWAAGFLPGQFWQMNALTGDEAWRAKAERWTRNLSGQRFQTGDLAHKFLTTYGPLYEQSGSSADRQVLLDAAASKNSQWSATVGAYRTGWFTGTDPAASFAVLMDMTTDMSLLLWAAKQTGNEQYRERAIAHTRKVIANQLRLDGSTAQFAMYSQSSGAFVRQATYQGLSSSSTWSRGQAWAMLSFTQIGVETGLADITAAAMKAADYYVTNAPADGVAWWDFADPGTYRDSSAAAIAASALLQLAGSLRAGSGGIVDLLAASRYRAAAETILSSLASPAYLAEGSIHAGLLIHAAGNVPNNAAARDTSLTYGDYYFLDATKRYLAGDG